MERRNLTAKGSKRTPAFAICAIMLLGVLQAAAAAQDPFTNKNYRIFPARQTNQSSQNRSTAFPRSTSPQPFQVESRSNQNVNSGQPRIATSERLASVFQQDRAEQTQESTSETVRDIFGESNQQDIFGENSQQNKPAEQPAISPFEKLEPAEKPVLQDDPRNPFGEIKPSDSKPSDSKPAIQPMQDPANSPFKEIPDANQPQDPANSPFKELQQDPNPITPPMDTTPVEPRLPEGAEFTPMPGQIDPNPPIPGEDPKPQDPVVQPTIAEPTIAEPEQLSPQITDDPGELTDTPEYDDIPDVPIPRSQRGKVYIPAKDPTAYGNPERSRMPVNQPNSAQQFANGSPYGNLPGPYGYSNLPGQPQMPNPNGYAAQPYAPPYPGYQASPYGMAPHQFGFGSQCGPGCMPVNSCGGCNSCNACNRCNGQVAATAMGCNSCGNCKSCCGPTTVVVTSDIESIGQRVAETGQAAIDGDSYTPVVSDCDSLCANYTNCYFGAFGGWSDLNDLVAVSDIGSGIYQEDAGYLFGIAIGQIQGRNLRTEVELSYRNININGLQLQGSSPSQNVGVFGDIGTLSGMLNGYWEFVDFGPEKFNPYFGGGLGFALARTDLIQANGAEAVISDDESSFAWQWMAGVNYKASSSVDAFVEYRYFAADSFRLDTEIPTVAGLGNGSGSFDFRSGSVLFGMRARF